MPETSGRHSPRRRKSSMEVDQWQSELSKSKIDQLVTAKDLLIEEAKIRKKALEATEMAVGKLMAALKDKQAKEGAFVTQLNKYKMENRMLNDLLKQQSEKSVRATLAKKEAEEKLVSVSQLLTTTIEKAKFQAALLKELQSREESAVEEVSRRAAQQAELRDTIRELERKMSTNQVKSSEALELQNRLVLAQEEMRKSTLAHSQEKTELNQVRIELEAKVAQLNGELAAARAQVERSRSAQVVANVPSQVNALQDKIDRQVVEIIRLKTEVTKREKDVLQHKRQIETQTKQISELENDLFSARASPALLSPDGNEMEETGEKMKQPSVAQGILETLQNELELAREELVKSREALHEEQRRSREKETTLQKEIVSLNEELLSKEQLQLTISQIEADLATSTSNLMEANRARDAETAELHEQLKVKSEEIERLQHQIETVQSPNEASDMELVLRKELEQRSLEILNLQAEIELNDSSKLLRMELDEKRSQILALTAEVEETKKMKESRSLSKGNDDLRYELEEKSLLVLSLQAEIQDLRSSRVSTEVEYADLIGELKSLHQECSEIKSETVNVKGKLFQLQDAARILPAKASNSQEFSELIEELCLLRDDCAEHKIQAHLMKVQLGDLQRIQSQNMERASNLLAIEEGLVEREEIEREITLDAHELRREAQQIGDATQSLLRKMQQGNWNNAFVPSQSKPSIESLHVYPEELDGTSHVLPTEIRGRRDSAAGVLATIQEARQTSSNNETQADDNQENGDFEMNADDAIGSPGSEAYSSTHTSGSSSNQILAKGYLRKAPAKFRPFWSRWNRRWFILTPSKLFYFRAPNSVVPANIISLEGATVEGPRDSVDEASNKFYLLTPEREFRLCASNRADARRWISSLQIAISQAHGHGGEHRRQTDAADQVWESFYDIIGVSRIATAQEIEAAYETLAAQYHPSMNQDLDLIGFEKLKRVYNVLGTPNLRSDYDISLDIKDLFQAGFVAILHFTQRSRAGRTAKVSFASVSRKFFTDENLTRIFWVGPEDDKVESNSPCVLISELEAVYPGENVTHGPLFELEEERSCCSFSLITISGSSVDIEVDQHADRDKILHGLQLIAAFQSESIFSGTTTGTEDVEYHRRSSSPLASPPPPPPKPPK